ALRLPDDRDYEIRADRATPDAAAWGAPDFARDPDLGSPIPVERSGRELCWTPTANTRYVVTLP
ncbi:MAG TPA: hypothetical protein VFQ54_08270, partial [Thermomicrobiales bacterium]|nr:hypothetical protein [Thermomicrobiales bacterium]